MSDASRRLLERRAAAQDGAAILALIREDVRNGLPVPPLVELHAHLGDLELRSCIGLAPDVAPDEARVRDLCSNPEHGLAYDDPIVGRMVYVPDGVSVLGADRPTEARWEDEAPRGAVYVPAFWIAQRPTTLTQWMARRADGAVYPGGDAIEGGAAVVNVSWNDCQEWLWGAAPAGASSRVFRGGSWWDVATYCRSAYRGRVVPGIRCTLLGFRAARSAPDEVSGLRLPTEDEWERAARGWDGRVYLWGNEWIEAREERRTKSSPWGVYDMSGEVWCWCQDAWSQDRHGALIASTDAQHTALDTGVTS